MGSAGTGFGSICIGGGGGGFGGGSGGGSGWGNFFALDEAGNKITTALTIDPAAMMTSAPTAASAAAAKE